MTVIDVKAVQYDKEGDARENLVLRTIKVDTTLKPKEVLIKWIASPLNPADINIARGVYFYRRKPPASMGMDGFGIVEKVGSSVTSLSVDDHIMPLYPNLHDGFWREYQVLPAAHLYRLNKKLTGEVKATFSANAATAYLMLKEFVKLKKGDYVLQNAANSQVGRAVIEICKAFGWQTINLVRDRPNFQQLKQELKALGGDYVFTEDEFRKFGQSFIKSLDRPLNLSINGVGGKSSILVSANLAKFGTMIVYGGMSLKPHEITTGSLVFKSIKVIGFQLYDYFGDEPEQETFRRKTYDELTKLYLAGHLHSSPMEPVPMENFKEAISKTMSGSQLKQLILISKDARAHI